jgi:hypothetical protein
VKLAGKCATWAVNGVVLGRCMHMQPGSDHQHKDTEGVAVGHV